MFSKVITACLTILIISTQSLSAANIGLLVMATGKYVSFIDPLVDSAEKHFCKEHNVTYFIFTDGKLKERDNVIKIYQGRLGWPYDTMMRYHVYAAHEDLLKTQDYLFACDADMLFVDDVGDEILGKRVATQHPGFINQRGSYETSPLSLAYVRPNEGKQYYAGGFYGGSAAEFLKILKTNIRNIDKDLAKGIVAVWHDESHWNRYCIDHPPTVILNPSYCYPESLDLPYPKKTTGIG